jgi:hypothetical protein
MGRRWLTLFAAAAGGCAGLPPVENPALVVPADTSATATGVPTPDGYARVYEKALDALDDYFEIKPGSRYSGQIETLPRPAGGYEQPWKPGSPDPRERLLATVQSIRHRALVTISPGEYGGYRVSVEVYKELEDLPRPVSSQNGSAAFREAATVDRRVEVVQAVASAPDWIPQGRDPAFENVILRKIIATCR